MRIQNILPLALSASAFLLPTEIKDDVGIVNKIPAFGRSDSISLKCVDGCPFEPLNAAGSESVVQADELRALVTVVDDKVQFNGEEIWPNIATAPLRVDAIKLSAPNRVTAAKTNMLVVSMVTYRPPEIMVDSTTNIKIHPIEIDILGRPVANHPDILYRAESVQIRVAETSDGLALLPHKIGPYKVFSHQAECTTISCRVAAVVSQKFREFRDATIKKFADFGQATARKFRGWGGCAGKKAHAMGGPSKFGPGSSLNPNNHHGHHGHHGHHHHHHMFAGFRAQLKMFLETFIFPTAFGLSAGLIMGAISWLLFSFIRRLRGSSGQYIVIEQVEVEDGLAGLPPTYEETYRQPQFESEDEKKELLQ